jgi:ACS family tartrate transporter-like MFS transporter
MILWGLVTMLTVFIRNVTGFYFVRFFLGAAEAGFYPGVILYLTYWFPARERARTVALFATGGVIAGIIGSPLSGSILGLDGKAGLDGWQWLFLLEGIPAVLMGLVVLFILPNRPQQVGWMTEKEKMWIQLQLDREATLSAGIAHSRLVDALASRKVWRLCLIYFLLNVGGYGFEMWLPSIIKGFSGMSYTLIGFINSIPYIGAVIFMLITGYTSDKTGERRWHVAFAAITSAVGFAFSAYLHNPYLAMASLTLAFVGLKCTVWPF